MRRIAVIPANAGIQVPRAGNNRGFRLSPESRGCYCSVLSGSMSPVRQFHSNQSRASASGANHRPPPPCARTPAPAWARRRQTVRAARRRLEQAVQVQASTLPAGFCQARRGSAARHVALGGHGRVLGGLAVVDLVTGDLHPGARPGARTSPKRARVGARSCAPRSWSPAAAGPGQGRCRPRPGCLSAPHPASAGRRRCPARNRRARVPAYRRIQSLRAQPGRSAAVAWKPGRMISRRPPRPPGSAPR